MSALFFRDALIQGLNAQGCGEGAEFIRNITREIFGEKVAEPKSDEQQQSSSKEDEKEMNGKGKPMDVDGSTIIIDEEASSSSNPIPSAPTATPENSSLSDPVIAEGLKQLREMGFSNHEVLVDLLRKHDGNLPYVIRDLLNLTK